MQRKLYLLLVVVVAGSLLVAGCGDDKKDNSKSSGSSSSSSSSGGSSSGGSTDSAAAKAAKDGCEAGIKNNAALEASKRDALSKECQKLADAAASGDKGKIKTAYKSYCTKLADALPAAAQSAARDACLKGADAIQ